MDPSQSSGTLNTRSPSGNSESSRTGSSRSGHSDATKDREIDLTKDNAASPIDLECQIQAERITKILDEAVFKTSLAICLPNLVAEYKTLSSALTQQHMDDLLFIFEQYENPMFSASLLNLEAMDDIKAGDLSLKNRLNPELGHLLYIMNSYPAIRPTVEEMMNKMIAAYKPTSPPNPSLEYFLALEKFRELIIAQMATTAAEELSAKIKTRKLEISNAKLKERIAEYSELLKAEQEAFQLTMESKAQTIAKLDHDLQALNYDANIKLKKKILDSERQMVLATRSHSVKCEMLKEEEVYFRETYEALLHNDMVEEKNQRARRCKVETQLLSWIQKYDLEMSEKQVELDELQEMYEEEVRLSEACEARLEEQNKEYIPLMAEREEEYHQEMMEKMNKFRQEHAARILQTAWREVLANRAEKKKLKRALAKVRAAAAAAEKLAEKAYQKQLALEKKANKEAKKSGK